MIERKNILSHLEGKRIDSYRSDFKKINKKYVAFEQEKLIIMITFFKLNLLSDEWKTFMPKESDSKFRINFRKWLLYLNFARKILTILKLACPKWETFEKMSEIWENFNNFYPWSKCKLKLANSPQQRVIINAIDY